MANSKEQIELLRRDMVVLNGKSEQARWFFFGICGACVVTLIICVGALYRRYMQYAWIAVVIVSVVFITMGIPMLIKWQKNEKKLIATREMVKQLEHGSFHAQPFYKRLNAIQVHTCKNCGQLLQGDWVFCQSCRCKQW